MTLHVEVAALLERVARSSLPAYHTVPAFVARRIYRDTRAALAPQPPAIAQVRLLVFGGKVAVRVYRPVADEALPALVFFHGGGWTIGDLDTHDVLCRQLATGARSRCSPWTIASPLSIRFRARLTIAFLPPNTSAFIRKSWA